MSLGRCPCMSGCPQGCPCPSYECQEPENPTSQMIFGFSGFHNPTPPPFLTDINGNVDFDVTMNLEEFTCMCIDRSKIMSLIQQRSTVVRSHGVNRFMFLVANNLGPKLAF